MNTMRPQILSAHTFPTLGFSSSAHDHPVRRAAAAGELRHALRLIALLALGPSHHVETVRDSCANATLVTNSALLSARPGVRVEEIVPEHAACLPTGDDVDDGIPEALQRQDEGGHVFKRVISFRVNYTINSVRGAGNPCNKQGSEEQNGALGVGPSGIVGFVRGAAPCTLGRPAAVDC